MTKRDLSRECKGGSKFKVLYHVNRMKEKNPRGDPNWCSKSIWQNATVFHDKNTQ